MGRASEEQRADGCQGHFPWGYKDKGSTLGRVGRIQDGKAFITAVNNM